MFFFLIYNLFYLIIHNLSLAILLACADSSLHFSLTSWRDKCPACVNGADESVREKRRQIGGAMTFIDKKKKKRKKRKKIESPSEPFLLPK